MSRPTDIAPPLDLQRSAGPLRRGDALLLGAFCLALFGFAMFGGRALSLHEARLPQTSREMLRNRDWLIPRSGGRPWLERPPLPHWIECGVSWLLAQHCDSVWVVRLPAALAGAAAVILVAWTAARMLGRWSGLAAGLVLATAWEFYKYGTLAEDDIFLAMIEALAVAFFVRSEWPAPNRHAAFVGNEAEPRGLFASRRWPVLGFFLAMGLTNLVKGPFVGLAVVGATVGAFLLWEANLRRIRRYLWLPGLVLLLALTAWWLVAVYRRYPDAIDLWRFDYAQTDQYDEKFWYYPVQLLGLLAPWTPAVLLGLWLTSRQPLATLLRLSRRIKRGRHAHATPQGPAAASDGGTGVSPVSGAPGAPHGQDAHATLQGPPAASNGGTGVSPVSGAPGAPHGQDAHATNGGSVPPLSPDAGSEALPKSRICSTRSGSSGAPQTRRRGCDTGSKRRPLHAFVHFIAPRRSAAAHARSAAPAIAGPALRFLWCWAIVPVIVLSIPHRKHHHYLVPSLAPWAILAVIGLRAIAGNMFFGAAWSRKPLFGLLAFGVPGAAAILLLRHRIPGAEPLKFALAFVWIACVAAFYIGLSSRRAGVVFGAFLAGLAAAYCWGQRTLPDESAHDAAFLRRADAEIPADDLLTIDADLNGELYFFRNQFYVRPDALLLHNLTFLRDRRLAGLPEVYVIARDIDQPQLFQLGDTEAIDQSTGAHKLKLAPPTPGAPPTERPFKFTLYRLHFRPDLERYPAPDPWKIETMQAMGRRPGPYCGPGF